MGRVEPVYLEIKFCTWSCHLLSFIRFTAFETKELEVREKNVMFLSCSLFDKWDAVRNAAALSCPSWLGVTRQQMEFGDEQM